MPTGILGANLVVANTLATVYTVPSGKQSVVTLSVLNAGFDTAFVRVAVSPNTTPNISDYIEWDAPISVSGVLERTGIVLGASQKLTVFTVSSNINSVEYGFEETAS